jgi:hypothetical protein
MYSHLNQAVAAEQTTDDMNRAARYRAQRRPPTGAATEQLHRRTGRVRWLGRVRPGPACPTARA